MISLLTPEIYIENESWVYPRPKSHDSQPLRLSTTTQLMSGYNVLFVLVIVAALMVTSWVFSPKGPNQTLIRTSSLLTLVCCYLMWMLAYMAQLHPLIEPVMAVGHE